MALPVGRTDGAGLATLVARGEADRYHAPVTFRPACSHLEFAPPVSPRTKGCEECLAIGGQWVHLRMCLHCGKVGCCDNSPNRHASAHFPETGHAVMQSIEPGEDWRWCFADEVYLEG